MSTTQIHRAGVRLPKWNGADSARSGRRLTEQDANVPEASPNAETKIDPVAGVALELIKQRAAPALFIVGPDNRVLYANEQTLSIFKDLNAIPEEVQGLCNRVRAGAADAPFTPPGTDCEVLRGPEENLYSFRGFLVKGQEDAPSHVMVLVERVAERGPINLKKARTQFGLSDREIEVVTLLAKGLCNKEIGTRLFVSEHTVKGHLKNITRKLGAGSRGNIIAILK